MAIEQLEHRLGRVQKTYDRIGQMIDSPGGPDWPEKFDLTKDPTSPEEALQFHIRTRTVLHVLDRLALARTTYESRIQTLQDEIAQQQREQLFTQVLDRARESVERRRLGGVGLTEEIMARVELAARLARQAPAEIAPSILPPALDTAPATGAKVDIIIPDYKETPREETVIISIYESPIPASLSPTSAEGEVSHEETPPLPPAPSQPEVITSLADFDQSELKLSPNEAKIFNKVQEEHPIDRLKLAQLIWPDASSDKAALNRLGNELHYLRTKMREKGVSIADIAGPDAPRAIYNFVTVEQEKALKHQQAQARALRIKKALAAEPKPAATPTAEIPTLPQEEAPAPPTPPSPVDSRKVPAVAIASADSGEKK